MRELYHSNRHESCRNSLFLTISDMKQKIWQQIEVRASSSRSILTVLKSWLYTGIHSGLCIVVPNILSILWQIDAPGRIFQSLIFVISWLSPIQVFRDSALKRSLEPSVLTFSSRLIPFNHIPHLIFPQRIDLISPPTRLFPSIPLTHNARPRNPSIDSNVAAHCPHVCPLRYLSLYSLYILWRTGFCKPKWRKHAWRSPASHSSATSRREVCSRNWTRRPRW